MVPRENVLKLDVFLLERSENMRRFEKISYQQFCKDCKEDIEMYQNYMLPERKTTYSAGYDFTILEDITIEPNESKLLPTGIKANMEESDVLFLVIRSSIAIKKQIQLTNQIGVVDSDYYNNPKNEGHIFISITNTSNYSVTLSKGEAYVQGIFVNYLTANEEIVPKQMRVDGIGSTS